MAKRQAWARSSLGANKKLSIGKSYSVLSMDRERLSATPVLSKKRSILRSKGDVRGMSVPNVMEVAPEMEEDVKSYTTDENNSVLDKECANINSPCSCPASTQICVLFGALCTNSAMAIFIWLVPCPSQC